MRQYLVQNRIIDSRYSPNGVLIAIALKIANYLKINVLKNLNGVIYGFSIFSGAIVNWLHWFVKLIFLDLTLFLTIFAKFFALIFSVLIEFVKFINLKDKKLIKSKIIFCFFLSDRSERQC